MILLTVYLFLQIHKDRKSADLSRARATGGVKRKKAHKAQKEKVAKEAEESSKASSSRYTLQFRFP